MTISLEDEHLTSAWPTFYIETIVDARDLKENIGLMWTFGNMKAELVRTKYPLKVEVIGLFQRSYAFDTSGRTPLLVRINKLFFIEKRAGALMDISLSFFDVSTKDTSYITTIRKQLGQKRLQGLKSATKFVTKGIDECIQEYCTRDAKKLLRKSRLHLRDLNINVNASAFSIFQAKQPKKGVYHSLEDFLENKPDTSTKFAFSTKKIPEVMGQAPFLHVRWKHLDSLENIPIWGVCDGNAAYALVANRYYEIEYRDSSFWMKANLPKSMRDVPFFPPSSENEFDIKIEVSGSAAVVFGSAILLATIINYAGGLNDAAVPNNNGPTDTYQIDPLTGELTPESELSERPSIDVSTIRSPIIFMASKYTKKSFKIRLNGEELCTLKGRCIMKRDFNLALKKHILEVELEGKTTAYEFVPSLNSTEVILIRNNNGKPRVEMVGSNVKVKLLEDIKRGRFETACSE